MSHFTANGKPLTGCAAASAPLSVTDCHVTGINIAYRALLILGLRKEVCSYLLTSLPPARFALTTQRNM